MEENRHAANLKSYCRFCNIKMSTNNVKYSTSKTKLKIRPFIITFLLDNDIENIHPEKVCQSCKRAVEHLNCIFRLEEKRQSRSEVYSKETNINQRIMETKIKS